MRYPKLRELREALRSLFGKPYTLKFPKEPSIPKARFRGKPEYYQDDCVGCTACAQVCPSSTIEVKDDAKSGIRTLTLRLDSCVFCGNCQANCITEKGIRLGNEYDLATYDRRQSTVSVQKELLVCEDCKCIIGAKDHIRFLARKLGVLAYGNPVMILANQYELKLAHKPEFDYNTRPLVDKTAGRPVMFSILCPKCRREMMLRDEWGGK